MTDKNTTLAPIDRDTSVLMWDMAGTLIIVDPVTRQYRALSDIQRVLPVLDQNFRLVVTTGNETLEARHILDDFKLLDHFENVFGGLGQPMGKPHGAVLAQLHAAPHFSLIIGDRLSADVAADTEKMVTILINQGQDPVDAGVVEFLIEILRKQNRDSFVSSFDYLTQSAAPRPDKQGPLRGGEITSAWQRDDGLGYLLWKYSHPLLRGIRRIIAL